MHVFKIITSSNRTESKHEITRWVVRNVDDTTLAELKKKLQTLFKTRSGQFYISWFDGQDYCTIRETCDLQDAVEFSVEEGKADKAIRVYASPDNTEHKTIFGEMPREVEQEKADERSLTPVETEDSAVTPRRGGSLGEEIIEMTTAELRRFSIENEGVLKSTLEEANEADEDQQAEPEGGQQQEKPQLSKQQEQMDQQQKEHKPKQATPPTQPLSTKSEAMPPSIQPQTSTPLENPPIFYPPQLIQGDNGVPQLYMPGYMMPPEMMAANYPPYYGYPPAYQGYPMPFIYPPYGPSPSPATMSHVPSAVGYLPTPPQELLPSRTHAELLRRLSVGSVASTSSAPPSTPTKPAIAAHPTVSTPTPRSGQKSSPDMSQKKKSVQDCTTSALHALRRMGYMQPEKYLIKLIKANHCNLNRVIDAIEKQQN